jgi:hypothetical protein
MDAKPVCHIFKPLADVAVSLVALPNAISMLEPLKPLAIIQVAIRPLVNTTTLHLPVYVFAFI